MEQYGIIRKKKMSTVLLAKDRVKGDDIKEQQE